MAHLLLFVWLSATLASNTPILNIPSRDVAVVHRVALIHGETRVLDTAEDATKIDFDELWLWSRDIPPVRRVRGESPLLDLASPPLRTINATVGASSIDMKTGGYVLAAPVAMWQSVPESMLPQYPVAKAGALIVARREPWRLRYVGTTSGSWWVDVPAQAATAKLAAFPAREHRIDIKGTNERITSAQLDAGETRAELAPGNLWARFAASKGVITIARVPSEGELALVARAPGYAPAAIAATLDTLPSVIELHRGSVFTGRVVDGANKPVEGADVIANGWISGTTPAQFDLHARTRADGTWSIENVPQTTAILTISKPGSIPFRQSLLVLKDAIETGTVSLTPGASLRLHVVDRERRPLAGVAVSISSGAAVKTDAKGFAWLRDLDANAELRLSLSMPGHIQREEKLSAPLPKDAELMLRQAFVVHGRFVTDEGLPVTAPRALLKQGDSDRTAHIAEDGAFELDLDPDREIELVLAGADVQQVTLPIEKGREGEQRDVGTVRAARGLALHGHVIDRANAQPLAGVRIWASQPSATGELLPWLRGNIIETRTRDDGEFTLTGLSGRVAVVRFEAPDYARLRRELTIEADRTTEEMGTIELDGGATLVISSRGVSNGEAKIDLTSSRSEIDILSAPMIDGVARISHVPAGEALLSVGSGVSVDCEKRITIARDQDTVDVRCDDRPPAIAGQVFAGETPVTGGFLTWTLADDSTGGIILNRMSGSGARQQRTYGVGPGAISIALDEQGRFSTTQLRAGEWTATWFPDGGGSAPARRVSITQKPSQFLALRFETSTLRGMVVDGDGRSVANVRVTELESHTDTISDRDGSFTMAGLPNGTWHLRATTSSRASRPAEVVLQDGKATQPVRLVLDESLRAEQGIAIVRNDGLPAPGAFVILETTAGENRLLTADANGHATASFPAGLSENVRLAVMHDGVWTFGDWQPVSENDLRVELPRTGTIVVRAEHPGDLEISTSNGWNVSAIYRRLGMRLIADSTQPTRIDGLPEGAYRVSLNGASRLETVWKGKESLVRFQ